MLDLLKNSRADLHQEVLDFLWRQWVSLGVPGNRPSGGDWIIDPEALILITTQFGRYDSRLMDLSMDWLDTCGQRVNLQRLQKLCGEWSFADMEVLAAISGILAEQSTLRKWKTLAKVDLPLEEPEPLFLNPDGTPLPTPDNPDRRFLRYQLLRSEWTPRGTSRPPDPARPGNLLLTLRSLFGVNARAEIFAWLLSHDSGHPAAIARDTGYFSKSIQFTLNEMEESGQIQSGRAGREKNFWLQRGDWQFLARGSSTGKFPRWINWAPVYYFISRTYQLLGEEEVPGTSANLRAIQQRGFLDEVAPALARSGLAPHMTASSDLTGTRLTEEILQDVAKLRNLLRTDFTIED